MKITMTSEEFSEFFETPRKEIQELRDKLRFAREDTDKVWEKYYGKESACRAAEREANELRAKLADPTCPIVMTEGQVSGLITAAAANQKIAGIKMVREILGLGLKEAKELYEAAYDAGLAKRTAY